MQLVNPKKKKSQEPSQMWSAPLIGLDHTEMITKVWLFHHFPGRIVSFENTVRVVDHALRNLIIPPSTLGMPVSDMLGDSGKIRPQEAVWSAQLQLALEALFAARLVFLHGYFPRMWASLRTVVEALAIGDICRADGNKAMRWQNGKRIPVKGTKNLHPIIQDLWTNYGFLNTAGAHPHLDSMIMTSLGRPAAMEAAYPDDLMDSAMDQIEEILNFLNDIAGSFLAYVDDTCSVNWSATPQEIQRMKMLIMDHGEEDTGERQSTRMFQLLYKPDEESVDNVELKRLVEAFRKDSMFGDINQSESETLTVFFKRIVNELVESAKLGYSERQGRSVGGSDFDENELIESIAKGSFIAGFEIAQDYIDTHGKYFPNKPPSQTE